MMAKDWLQATMEVITEVTMMPPKGVIFLLMDRMRPLTPVKSAVSLKIPE